MAETRHIRILLDGLTCAGCVRRAEAALSALDGVTRAEVNLADGSARIEAADPVALRDIAAALDRAGYPMRQAETVLSVDRMSCASCVGGARRPAGRRRCAGEPRHRKRAGHPCRGYDNAR